jgi:hypothetical protein
MSANYIPGSDRMFLTWINSLLKYLLASLARFGVPGERYQQLAVQRDDFSQKLDTAEEPATRTKLTVLAKDKVRKKLEADIRQFVNQYLAYNPEVTDVDHEGLGIPIHSKGRHPSPLATTYPDFDVDSSMIRRLTIHFYDQGSVKSKAKPAGQHGAEIRWAILDTPPVDVKELIHSSFDTRTPFTLEFEGHECGKTVYFCLCWENTRGEKGPWSKIVSAIIP